MMLKRVFDIAVALFLLAVLSPLMLFVAILIGFEMGMPVIFRQVRPGLNGKLFVLFKFRTMNQRVDSKGGPLPDAQRMTALGGLLRRLSLDELPQLVNVLRGDMSLVGPRPLLPEYLPLYSSEQARRHEVRPGITGWAQVNGRNAVSWEERFRLDVWYVDHCSLMLDFRILRMTVIKVFKRSGISEPGQETMTKFSGSAPQGTVARRGIDDVSG